MLADAVVEPALGDFAHRLAHQFDRLGKPVGHEEHRHRDGQHRDHHQHRHQAHRQARHLHQRLLAQAQRNPPDPFVLERDRRFEAEHRLAGRHIVGHGQAALPVAEQFRRRWLVGLPDPLGLARRSNDAFTVDHRDALEIARLHDLLQRHIDRDPVVRQRRHGVLRRDETRQRRAGIDHLVHHRRGLPLRDDAGRQRHHHGDDQAHHGGPLHAQRHDARLVLFELGLVDVGQHPAQCVRQFLAVLKAPVRCLGQAALDHAAQRGGQVGAQLFDRRRIFLGDLHRQRHQAVADERALPGEHLVQQDAGREQVGSAIELVALRLLGRHVLRRAQNVAHAGAVF